MAVHRFPSSTQNVIACVWDFDKTLIPGYMQEPIFRRFKVDESSFWDEVNGLPRPTAPPARRPAAPGRTAAPEATATPATAAAPKAGRRAAPKRKTKEKD